MGRPRGPLRTCPDCGDQISRRASRCRDCYRKAKTNPKRLCERCGVPVLPQSRTCRSCYHNRPLITVEERIWRYIVWNGDADECWTWEGATTGSGYGHINLGPGLGYAPVHRLIYELFAGPIPEELEMDHTCHNSDLDCPGGLTCLHRRCVNPTHLEAVTQSVNAQRGRTGEHMRRG